MAWNGLGVDGMGSVAQMLKTNNVLTYLDVSHNNVEPEGCKVLAEALQANVGLLRLELGFNPLNLDGLEALTVALHEREHKLEQLGVECTTSSVQPTPRRMERAAELRRNYYWDRSRYTTSATDAFYSGTSSRVDLKAPDGHYTLDLTQPWDRYVAKELLERSLAEAGESWINVVVRRQSYLEVSQNAIGLTWRNVGTMAPVNSYPLMNDALAKALQKQLTFTPAEWEAFGIQGLTIKHYVKSGDQYFEPARLKSVPACQQRISTEMPNPDSIRQALVEATDGWEAGTLEFDYVSWKRGLEASFSLDLAEPADLFLAEKLIAMTNESNDDEGIEELRDCFLDDDDDDEPGNQATARYPFDTSGPLPSEGRLKVVYGSTKPQNCLTFPISLDLSRAEDAAIGLRLWERVLTTATDDWQSPMLNGAPVRFESWLWPNLPTAGALTFTYAVQLSAKQLDRGIFFTPAMPSVSFNRLVMALTAPASEQTDDVFITDPDKAKLIRQAAARNYFNSAQVKMLIDLLSARTEKQNMAEFLFPRTTDQVGFRQALESLNAAEADAIMDKMGKQAASESYKSKIRSTGKKTAALAGATRALVSAAAAASAPADAEGTVDDTSSAVGVLPSPR